MRQGYIKLWRKSTESSAFQDPELWKLWCLCLTKASYKEKWVSLDSIKEPIKLLPGQFITGRYELHKLYYSGKKKNRKSPLTIWRWLQVLEKHENLNIKSYTKYSIITICNWKHYQQDEQQTNNRRTTDEHKQER